MDHRLRLYHGNRLERLADDLAKVLKKPLESPLAEEVIVVQSKGMERWICLQLAEQWGICCNCRFPFPNALLRELYRAVIGVVPERSGFEPDVLAWRIMQCLPAVLHRDAFRVLRKYVGDAAPGSLRRAQLSHKIARTFDHYLVYRRDLLEKWEQEPQNHWQAQLWCELTKTTKEQHPGALARRFMARLGADDLDVKALPERISVFGVSYLPPLYLEILAALSRRVPVHLFVLNPCRAYWFDIVTEKRMYQYLDQLPGGPGSGPRMPAADSFALDGEDRTEGAGANNDLCPLGLVSPVDGKTGIVGSFSGDLHLEQGNPLLAAMGTQGRHFLSLAYERAADDREAFEDPGETTLLSCIQSDILQLQESANVGSMPAGENPEMPSIQIHSCHSPMREVEVLHDQLLDLFERDPGLRPSDILVMTPDIDTYAPYIQAVFDAGEDESARIPYSLSDRSLRRENPYVEVLMSILEMIEGRFQASRVLDLLAKPVVRTAFGIDPTELERIVGWVQETRIRWAMDGEHRSSLGLPPTRENTWQAGLDRLLLGYALAPQGTALVGGILPHDGVAGGDGTMLGNLVEFIHLLYRQIRNLETPAPLSVWSKRLFRLLDRFVAPNDSDQVALDLLRKTLFDLSELQELSGFTDAVERPVIQWLLGERFDRGGARFGFLSGGVTVCAMLPMRSIPFRVICLLGMGYEGFPRRPVPLSFDLMAARPRPGDPSPGADDRYLFLETILSARDRLHISYVGQSIQDNSMVPPSVLVSELLDTLEQGFFQSRDQLMDRLVTRHRLQAFSPHYFDANSGFFSYSKANCEAALQLQHARREAPAFFNKPLAEPADEWRTLSLDSLCWFFDNPARALLRQRLKLDLEDSVPILEDLEPFELSALDRYWIADRLLQGILLGQPIRQWEAAVRAEGDLPHGVPGELAYHQLVDEVSRFAEKIAPRVVPGPLEPLPVALHMAEFSITGTLDSLYPNDLVVFRFGRIRSKDRLRIWIRHLVLNVLGRDHYPRTGLLIGADKNGQPQMQRFDPVTSPVPILEQLLEIYRQGLREPLRFFPETSLAYAEALCSQGKDEAGALKAATVKWQGFHKRDGRRVPGECEKDAYLNFCFGDVDPFDDRFRDLAVTIFGPLLEHQREVE